MLIRLQFKADIDPNRFWLLLHLVNVAAKRLCFFPSFYIFFFNRMPRFMHVQIYKTIAYIIGANAAGIQIILFNELTAYAI